MTFSVFVPDHDPGTKLPVLWHLSGLTCTHANVTEKGEYRRACAEAGIVFVAPDTSPRGDDVPDDDAYDFGDATEAPWRRISGCAAITSANCPISWPPSSRSTWAGRGSPDIRWAGMAR